MGWTYIYSGGGYFRLFPSSWIQKWFGEDNYVMTYFHPRDFDDAQPIVPGLSPIRRFKSYVGIRGARRKLEKLLATHNFVDVRKASQSVIWESVPRIDLESYQTV